MDKKFSVYTITVCKDDKPSYVHWAKNLEMYITKDDVTIKLDSEEIQQLVKSLPRTLGRTY